MITDPRMHKALHCVKAKAMQMSSSPSEPPKERQRLFEEDRRQDCAATVSLGTGAQAGGIPNDNRQCAEGCLRCPRQPGSPTRKQAKTHYYQSLDERIGCVFQPRAQLPYLSTHPRSCKSLLESSLSCLRARVSDESSACMWRTSPPERLPPVSTRARCNVNHAPT